MIDKIAPLTVVDFRVYVYNILHHYQAIDKNYGKKTQQAWLKAAWALHLNRGFTDLPYFEQTVVVVDDHNPYWRTKYLEDRGFPPYKDGRKQKGDDWYKVAEAGKKYILDAKCPFHYLSFPGYEADDVAAALVRVRAPRLIILSTVDSDWSGLVLDSDQYRATNRFEFIKEEYGVEPTVWWVNHAHWTPRFRDEAGVRAWTKKRCRIDIDRPWELWEHKAEEGDKSDNLPPGSPIEVIDLLNPPEEHDILLDKTLSCQVEEVAHSYAANSSKSHILKAQKWFRANGFRIPVVDWNNYLLDR